MTSVPLAAPIRQPRGPPSDTSASQPAFALSPPTADADSLRRANTVSTPRHQPSASVSSTLATTSAFHGQAKGQQPNNNGRFKVIGRFRSGSLSSGDAGVNLVRKGSGREAVRPEQAVVEDEDPEEEQQAGTESFGKGLSRQSSLPSRRFGNAPTVQASTDKTLGSMGPPPRPPRRIQVDTAIAESMSPPPLSAHIASHSLSSMHMFSPPAQRISLEEPIEVSGAAVSRTQSLRNQARHSQSVSLGRSSSLRDASETGTSRFSHQPSPSLHSTTFSPHSPAPPPASSTAALPPFQLSGNASDIRRHQSLGHGHNRQKDRPESRDEKRGDHSVHGHRSDPPPTSPIGPSMWSAQAGDNGWSTINQLSDTFDNLQLNRRVAESGVNYNAGHQQAQQPVRRVQGAGLLPPMPMTAGQIGEPSWVAGLVGHDVVPRPRSANAPSSQWQLPESMQRPQQGMLPLQPRWDQGPQLGYLPQHQQQPQLGPYGMPMRGMSPNINPNMGQYPGYAQPPLPGLSQNPGYMGTYTNTPTPSAHMLGPQDQAVIELARSKGLNPASFNCRPQKARFFVIKSYTEEDVQKSLKHEIWSSTVLGNKRLDTAFREFSHVGPIYLFFSVNGSRHFCGVAEMLTAVDESQNSTVWASDKWKGIFKVKWIFVRDVPTPALRHIRLLNTPEQKPITNSRDTQELHYDAGCEVLQIFLDHQTKSKTSLLQDFAYYEQLSAQRESPAPGHGATGPPHQVPTPPPVPHQFQMPANIGPSGIVPPVPAIPARYR